MTQKEILEGNKLIAIFTLKDLTIIQKDIIITSEEFDLPYDFNFHLGLVNLVED